MCKAQQSYLPYLTAAGSGTLPINLLITPCAGYQLACRTACATHGLPETEPSLFEVSHCPIFKLTPVFVSNHEFVVLNFASLPKVDAVERKGSNERKASKSSVSAKGAKSSNSWKSSLDSSAPKTSTESKSFTVTNGPKSSLESKTSTNTSSSKPNPNPKDIEILSTQSSGEWFESPSSLSTGTTMISPLSTLPDDARNASLVSPMTPFVLPNTPKAPPTPRTIGAGMMSPRGCGNMAMNPLRISCAVGKHKKQGSLNSAAPRLERLKEEDEEWEKLRSSWREECDIAPKEV